MTWTSRYQPPTIGRWQGRSDTPANSCFFQKIILLNLLADLPIKSGPAFALLGFNCDEGVKRNQGRIGAVEGPTAIREMLAKLPLQRADITCYDAGDIICEDDDLEFAQGALAEAINKLLKQNIIPIVLGGGHEVAWGNYSGIALNYRNENLGIVNFDAHFDMRPLLPNDKGSSGTPFLQIALAHKEAQRRFDYNCIGIQAAGNIPQLFAIANEYHTHILLADVLQQGSQECNQLLDSVIKNNDIVYLSICLDVFAAPYAPGVSAPQTLGLTPWQVIPGIRKLAQSGKVISYDIAELCPKYDKDQRTAKLAANLVFEIIHHHKNN